MKNERAVKGKRTGVRREERKGKGTEMRGETPRKKRERGKNDGVKRQRKVKG